MANEFITELKNWANELIHSNGLGDFIGMQRAVGLISKHFAVQPHEVAILVAMPDDRFLRFVTPENLQGMGQIPLTSANSLAVRTAREKRPEMINHFSAIPHTSVFEAVPISEAQPGVPIQKIMSAPILLDKKVIGVIQVSRKGPSPSDAGPDFVPQQLRELKTIADTIAPCVPLCAKESELHSC
jgi:GAF domain-containing protein